MELPKVFKHKKLLNKFYLAILISDSSIQAALWQVLDNQVILHKKSLKRIYVVADQAVVEIDKALQELGKQSENVDEVVFGLQPTWVENQDVAPIKKPLLKDITQDLSLKAVGFVITSEALARHLTAQNPRLSTLLIEFSQHELYLSLINQGKLVSTKFVGRSEQTIADMTEALARLNAHQEEEIRFPAKMLLCSLDLEEAELQEQQQLLLEHDWINSHPFTQPPVIEVLKAAIVLDAIVEQGGVSVAGIQDSRVEFTQKTQQTLPLAQENASEILNETAVEAPELVQEPPPLTQAKSFGVEIKFPNTPQAFLAANSEKPLVSTSAQQNQAQSLKLKQSMKFFTWFKEHRFFVFGGFVAGLLALGAIGWIFLSTGVQAVIALGLKTQTVTNEATVILDPDITTSDVEKLILVAKVVEEQVAGSKTKDTTGSKVVGDQAVGKIMIYNATDGEKTFEKGTQLAKGNLLFTLDEETKVASASVQKSNGTKEYGKTEAQVTAVEIGADSNLTKETELQVAKFDTSTYYAVVETNFTGGSSREIRVVSPADKAELIDDLSQELKTKANQAMKEQLEDGSYLVETNKIKIDQEKLTAAVGDEVNSVTLDLELTVQALAYKTTDLQPLAQKVLEDQVPEGYTLAESKPQILSASDQEATGSGAVSLVVNISSLAKPDLDLDSLRAAVVGKSFVEVEKNLSSNEFIDSVEIQLIPSIVSKFYPRIPKDPAKIKIQ